MSTHVTHKRKDFLDKAEVIKLVGSRRQHELTRQEFPRPVLHGEELLWYTNEVLAYLALPRKRWSARG